MKKMTIEAALTWAFCEELPKTGYGSGVAATSGSTALSNFLEMGTIIDQSPNGYGVIPTFGSEGLNPDALVIGDAVRALDCRTMDLNASIDLFPDMDDPHGLIRDAVALQAETWSLKGELQGRHLVNLVTTCAILKRGPDWRAEQPHFDYARHENGRARWFIQKTYETSTGRIATIEDDGYDTKRNKPKPGAYRKFRLSDPMAGDIQMRLDWQLWQASLAESAVGLTGKLSIVDLIPFRPNFCPWEMENQRK